MKVIIRDRMGVTIAEGDTTWVVDPQINAEYIGAFQRYSFPLLDEHGTFLAQVELIS